MNETITIEEKILNDIKNSFESEVNEFSTKNNKKNSNYIFSCSDPVIKEMSSNLNTLYSDIDKSYKTMNDWLIDYKKNYDQLEKSLASGSNTASDSNIRNYLQQFISKINGSVKKVTKSFDGKIAVDFKVIGGAASPSEFKEIDETELNELNIIKDEVRKSIEDLDNQMFELYKYQVNSMYECKSIPEEELEKINEEQSELEKSKKELELLEKEIDKEIRLYPYEQKKKTKEYQDFINNYNSAYQDLDYDALEWYQYDLLVYQGYCEESVEIDKIAIVEYVIDNNPTATFEELDSKLLDLDKEWNLYKYMSEEQRQLYHFIFKTEGESQAEEYLSLIQDSINAAEGAAKAAEFIENLDLTDTGLLEESLSNVFQVSKKGLGDGIKNFCEGLENLINNNEEMTATDYEKAIILQYLQENSNYFDSTYYYDEMYEFASALGNMIPSIVTSALVSYLATPAAGEVVASALMGLSASGNAKHQALVDGSSQLSSVIYGICVGLSESTLGYFLGNIPGISKEVDASILAGMFKEGAEEYTQEWIDAGLRSAILGENINLDKIGEDATKSFIMGALMSGILTGSQKAIEFTINGITKKINLKELQEFIDEHPDMKIEDIFREAGIISNTDLNYNENDFSKMYDYDIQSFIKYLKDAGYEYSQINKFINSKSVAIHNAMQTEMYLHGKGPMPNYILENEISNSKYQRVVDGFKFVSDSAEGLDRLIHYYNDSKNNSSSKYFFKKLERNHRSELIITNIDEYISYFNTDIIININNQTIESSTYATLYHELGHYLDTNNKSKLFKKRYIFDPLEPYIQQDYKQIEAGFNKLKYDYNNELNKFKDYYLNNSIGKKELDEIAYKKMDEKYGTIWRTDSNYKAALDTVKTEVYSDLMENYMNQNGYCSIIDIMSTVGLYLDGEPYSHSSSYYNNNAEIIDDWGKSDYSLPRTEIIAELNALYLTGNFDKLYDYFPKDLVDKWRKGIEKVNGTKGR